MVVHRVQWEGGDHFPKDVRAFVRWVRSMNDHMGDLAAEMGDELGFDLVHSHDWLVAGAARRVARSLRRPWLTTVHATEYGAPPGLGRQVPAVAASAAAERDMVHRADHVITCSHYMRSHVADVFGIPAAKDHRDAERHRSARPGAGGAGPGRAAGAVRRAPMNAWCCWWAAWSTRRGFTWRSTRSRR